MREPTLTLLTRSRAHGIEAAHGDFEHEYRRAEYVDFLEQAGFLARSVGVRWFHASGLRRVLYRPPLTWLQRPAARPVRLRRREDDAAARPSPLAASRSARSKSSG